MFSAASAAVILLESWGYLIISTPQNDLKNGLRSYCEMNDKVRIILRNTVPQKVSTDHARYLITLVVSVAAVGLVKATMRH